MSDWSNSQYPKTCAILETLGYDPATIAVEHFGPDGYATKRYDAHGKRVYIDDEFQFDHHDWKIGHWAKIEPVWSSEGLR